MCHAYGPIGNQLRGLTVTFDMASHGSPTKTWDFTNPHNPRNWSNIISHLTHNATQGNTRMTNPGPGHPHHLGQHQTHHFRQHPEITHSSHFGRSLWATRISSLWATRKTSFLSSHYLTQPFRVWLGGVGGDKSVIDAGNKGGIHGLKSSLDSAI